MDLLGRALEQIIGQPERRLAPDPGQASELGGQIVDRRHLEVRELERQGEAASELLHLLLIEALRPLLRLRDRGEDEVLEHLHVLRIDDGRIDPDLTNTAPTIGGDRNHPATARSGDGLVAQLGLELAQTGLYLLAHLQNLLKVRHRREPLTAGEVSEDGPDFTAPQAEGGAKFAPPAPDSVE